MISKWIVHPKIAKWGKQTFGKKSPLIASKKFDKIISEPYSKEGWAVMPTKPLPENEEIANFLLWKNFQNSIIENPGTPHCAKCWFSKRIMVPFELNEDGDLECVGCGFIIPVKKE